MIYRKTSKGKEMPLASQIYIRLNTTRKTTISKYIQTGKLFAKTGNDFRYVPLA